MERYNPEYKRRRKQRKIDGRVRCRRCGKRRGPNHYGLWCPSCYTELTQWHGNDKPALQMDRAWRIAAYAERADAGKPLFSPPLSGVMA